MSVMCSFTHEKRGILMDFFFWMHQAIDQGCGIDHGPFYSSLKIESEKQLSTYW